MKLLSLILLCSLFAISTLAADLNGTWSGTVQGREGNAQEVTLTLKASGGTLTGTISNAMGDNAIENGKVNGDQISFSVTAHRGDQSLKINYTGKADGNQLHLTMAREGATQTRDFTLTKK
jgi:hypothetical protein